MKKWAILIASLCLNLDNASGMTFLTEDAVIPDSIADLNELRELDAIVQQELTSGRSNRDSIVLINQKLEALDLPAVDLASRELDVSIPILIGFANSSPVGVSIVDGRHRYCFPCAIARNYFMFGIQKWEQSERNESGKYFAFIEVLAKHQRYRENGTVNSWNWPAKRHALIAVYKDGRQGVLRLYDDAAEFFAVPFPKRRDISPRLSVIQATDGTRIALQIRSGGDGTFSVEEIPTEFGEGAAVSSEAIGSDDVHAIIEALFKERDLVRPPALSLPPR